MPRKTSAEIIIDAIVENGDAPMDRAALQDFFMDRTNFFVDFRKLWEFYEAFIGGYRITARSLNTMRSQGGKAFAAKIKARLDSEPGVVPDHLIDFFSNHQYIWDSSLGDGDTQAEPGRLPKELLDQLKRVCPDRQSFESLLMQQMTAQSVPSGMNTEVTAKLMRARAKEVAEEVFGKDESVTDGLIAAVKKGSCPSFEVTKAFRGYGFEVICHRDDVAKLFDIYVHLITTCGVDRDTLNEWMISGKQTLGQNIKAELEKKQDTIPAGLIPWLDANQYIWARGSIAYSGQTNAFVRHSGVKVVFQRFVKPVKPEEHAKINQEMQELVDSFHNLKPGEPEFDLQEEIERRAKKYGCYQVAMTYPKKDEISDVKDEIGTEGK
ncbi:hypothetical protein COL940_014293 [Colletotrichum noveboracense]|nr:hypothetical protein COL940_014293 [Colletotrichum noveboracense]KAJ0269867.1 hypothetical protein CBS470a_013653 [Colletotrichum nupharicola]